MWQAMTHAFLIVPHMLLVLMVTPAVMKVRIMPL